MSRKLLWMLLLAAVCFTSIDAFAFGGGGHHRVSTRYKIGVDSMGLHVDPDNPITPPVFIDCDDQTETEIKGVCCPNEKVYANGTKCCDKDGYEIKEDACQKQCATGLMPVGDECQDLCEDYTPTECKPTCDWKTGEGIPLAEGDSCGTNKVCDASAQCVCDEGYEPDGQGGCKESCPTDRQCGETCCGEGNVCVNNTYCCHKDYEDWGDVEDFGVCCLASESTGFDLYNWTCCGTGETTYLKELYTRERYTFCCAKDNLTKGIGYNGQSVCCAHEPETGYKDFKVCWASETNCKTNADCETLGDNYFCNLKNETDESCYYPTSGTCEQITSSNYTDASVDGLGAVRKSTNTMTWWAAENWCKAQKHQDGTPMHLIPIEKFQVYRSGTTTLVTEGSENWSYGCAEGKKCGVWSNPPYQLMWNGNTLTDAADGNGEKYRDKYSPVMTNLRVKFNSNQLWTASDYSSTDSCGAFLVGLGDGYVLNYPRNLNDDFALCE